MILNMISFFLPYFYRICFLCVVLIIKGLSITFHVYYIQSWYSYDIFFKLVHNTSSKIFKHGPLYILPLPVLSDSMIPMVVFQHGDIILHFKWCTFQPLLLCTVWVRYFTRCYFVAFSLSLSYIFIRLSNWFLNYFYFGVSSWDRSILSLFLIYL